MILDEVKLGVTGDMMDEIEWGEKAYAGTAGAMLDFSLAAGLEPIRSSFSRRVFSWEMILRVAILLVFVGERYRRMFFTG